MKKMSLDKYCTVSKEYESKLISELKRKYIIYTHTVQLFGWALATIPKAPAITICEKMYTHDYKVSLSQ